MSAARQDVTLIKEAARGRWPEFARSIGIAETFLDGNHGRCPKCDGGDRADRWRVFSDFAETGGAICNRCGSMSDGIALARWFCDWTFLEAIKRIATYLGLEPQL